jgi:hypothetical protein
MEEEATDQTKKDFWEEKGAEVINLFQKLTEEIEPTLPKPKSLEEILIADLKTQLEIGKFLTQTITKIKTAQLNLGVLKSKGKGKEVAAVSSSLNPFKPNIDYQTISEELLKENLADLELTLTEIKTN